MRLHFTKDVLPDSVSSDFQKLNKFSEQQFLRLIEILFQFLLEPKEVRTHTVWMTSGHWVRLFRCTVHLEVQSVTQPAVCVVSSGLNEDKAAHFSQQWAEHHAALCQLAIGHTLMVNQLVDMEWKFGVTVGTSEVQKVGNIFLQLKLVIRKGNSTENVYMELTLPQFYNFLHEMEKAKASMECFS
uniref:COMM domain-containing protein n=1 Tax=Mola mola TaxID=94237 RepID=A0A3Q3WWT8_MOLML